MDLERNLGQADSQESKPEILIDGIVVIKVGPKGDIQVLNSKGEAVSEESAIAAGARIPRIEQEDIIIPLRGGGESVQSLGGETTITFKNGGRETNVSTNATVIQRQFIGITGIRNSFPTSPDRELSSRRSDVDAKRSTPRPPSRDTQSERLGDQRIDVRERKSLGKIMGQNIELVGEGEVRIEQVLGGRIVVSSGVVLRLGKMMGGTLEVKEGGQALGNSLVGVKVLGKERVKFNTVVG